jgi:formiminotetrahydrofolate cyclodeaminase
VNTSEISIGAFSAALAARQATPGGGAAAAVAVALGCASGAMAARYTTGPKWADRSADAEALAQQLDAHAARALALADEDAAAFAAVGMARKAGDAAALATAEAASLAVPVHLLELIHSAAVALANFSPRCNPNLISDVQVGLHLLDGAAAATLATLRVNRPSEGVLAAAEALVAGISRCARSPQDVA